MEKGVIKKDENLKQEKPDYKEYARLMREQVTNSENGVMRVSVDLWLCIADIVEGKE